MFPVSLTKVLLPVSYTHLYFYGDDEEDSEIIRKEGQIEPLKTDKEPYEAIVSAEGSVSYTHLDVYKRQQ